MRLFLFLAFLLLPFAVMAQSETCPRVWRSGDSLLTDPAPQIQWLRDGAAIPDANERWLIPDEVGRYSVVVRGGLSPAFPYEAGVGYTLAGYVFDELHRPVEGAAVRRGPFTAITDEKGRFVLSVNEAKPAEQTPVVVTVEKTGYWQNASRQYVSRFHTTETRIMLHTQRVTNRVDATKGGEMAYRGFSLQLPPHSVQTESGTPYSGTILLSVEGALPSEPDFGLRMPGGDFSAIDESGNDVMLYSYGYMSVVMTAENGDKLELRPEARATLRFQLPYTETHRPDSVPLWHFNTETAIWEQEGWSVRNGSIYEGQVSHFSSWNCDVPADRSTCRGRVIDCNDDPVKGGWVRVGQRHVVTDVDGNYLTFVPGGITFDAWASVDTLREITVPAQEERTLDDLRGSDISGFAVYNPVSRELSAYLSGNVPENLRLSIDGGQSWAVEREFTNVAAAPSEIRLEGGCTDRLPIVVLPKPEDCQKRASGELWREIEFRTLEEALSSGDKAYRLKLNSAFTIEWNLLLRLGCLHELQIINNLRMIDPPESIGNLVNLQSLTFANNMDRLTSLPESLGNLVTLEILSLGNNRLTFLPTSIGNLSNLKTLYLKDNLQLTSLPESIGNLTNLLSLSLDRNQIATLPESVWSLTNLQSLSWGHNQVTDVPERIGNLTKLRFLNLGYGNQLTSLPESIGNLTALEYLYLEHNKLTYLPESIGNLSSLQWLILDGNSLSSLPESIGNLSYLVRLSLDFNKLNTLPVSIGNLSSLQILILSGNQLTDLPDSIANLADTLRSLYLKDNPIPVDRRAAIQALLPNTEIHWE